MDIVKIIVTLICAALILAGMVATMRVSAAKDVTPIAPAVCTEGLARPAACRDALRRKTVSISRDDAYILALMAWGEARGCSDMEIAATMWCVCNRCDAWGKSVFEIVTAPAQFAGYHADTPFDDHIYRIAIDVLTRWELERTGAANVGRVLPAEYLWFTGDGCHNYFRDGWPDGNVWDWSLPDVYGEA